MSDQYIICLTKRRYQIINVFTTIFILVPGFAAVVLSISCILQRVFFEVADFSLDVSFFLYRIIVAIVLVWEVIESIFCNLYGHSKFGLSTIIWYMGMVAATGITINGIIGGGVGWSDLFQLPAFTPIVLVPLGMLAVVVLAIGIFTVIFITMFICDLCSWCHYARREAAEGRDSQPFIIFCRDNSWT